VNRACPLSSCAARPSAASNSQTNRIDRYYLPNAGQFLALGRNELRVEQHPDTTSIGRIERGFSFLAEVVERWPTIRPGPARRHFYG
jgi:hypothetical protein